MLLRLLFCLLFFGSFQLSAQNTAPEIWGPYPSWANIKTRFGARGDGKTDDTRAFQQALDSLTVSLRKFNIGKSAYTTIYIPAGRYVISQTLQLKGKLGINILGEDPDNTIIIWKGSDNDTLFWANGSAYYKIGRLTWDANGRKKLEGIGIHWKDRWDNRESQSYAALNIEISDCNFRGGFARAISGGTSEEGTGHNDSEISIRRCQFFNCTESGIKIRGYNALDYWIWDCRFYNCYQGVYNEAGNYHLYRCYFFRSQSFDVYNSNGYYTSLRGCYSFRSGAFSGDNGSSCNPFKRIFQDNTVVGTRRTSVQFFHLGKITLLDNNFSKNPDTVATGNVDYRSWCPGSYEVLSINNRYENPHPVEMAVLKKKLMSFRDNIGKLSSKPDTTSFLKTMQRRGTKVNRVVYEVDPGANAKDIQLVIDKATKTRKPVAVHFPVGQYVISQPLVIPASADIQWVGDGMIYSSVIIPGRDFPKNQSMITVMGPTRFGIADIQLGQTSSNKDSVTILTFAGADQAGAQAFTDQIYSSATHTINLEKVCNLYVQNDNSFFCTGNRVIGCDNCQGNCTSRLASFGGQFAGIKVENNGNFVAKDCWWEGNKKLFQDISGKGNITIDGAMIAPLGADSTPSLIVNNFEGKITLANMYIQGGIKVNEPGDKLSILGWNLHFYHKMQPVVFAGGSKAKGLFRGLTTQCFDAKNPDCNKIATVNDSRMNLANEDDFMVDMFAKDRECKPAVIKSSSKSSLITVSRVAIGNSNKGIVFTR